MCVTTTAFVRDVIRRAKADGEMLPSEEQSQKIGDIPKCIAAEAVA